MFNRHIVNKPILAINRLYSDEKINSVEVAKNVEQIQINEKPERHSHNKAVENHFETGISITSYNTVIYVTIDRLFLTSENDLHRFFCTFSLDFD